MEWFSSEWFVALASIIIIDLVLAGDNAIVIGLAARNLDKSRQKTVIWAGTAGAIVVRVAATFAVVWLLKIPGLMLAGGLILLYIAYNLLADKKDHSDVKAANSLWAAIRTIIIADAVMGLDNVLAIAGASTGNMELVIIGLLISVPIVVWGSMIIIQLIDRFPLLLYVGSGVLVFTAGKMIAGEAWFSQYFAEHVWVKYGMIAVLIAAVLTAGKLTNDARRRKGRALHEPPTP